MSKSKTFTLIEMLIVIIIIGILAAALVPRLQSIQSRARDSKRKVDLRTIYNANEIYFFDNGIYVPDTTPALPNGPGAWRHSYNFSPRLPELTWIMTNIPIDPINTHANSTAAHSWYTWGYHYTYWSYLTWAVNSYDLAAQLENPQDPDRNEIRGYRYNNETVQYPWWQNSFFVKLGQS